MDDWVTIKKLRAKNPEMSLREIGRMLNMSHHTVQSALERESPPQYEMTGRENVHLAPFKDLIFEMVNVKRFRGSRILEEIRSKGYRGGKTAFYSYVKNVKIESQKHFTPYETLPGEQSQFDWSPYSVLIGGELMSVIFFAYINAFSRFQIFQASRTHDQGSVFQALEDSLIESGGVPGRIQTDNAKVFVTNASKNNFQWNQRYLHFCGHYGFQPARSLPRHPWSKGKVEKPFQYLEDHFIAGNSFRDFEDLIKKLKVFQQTVARRMHATLKASPEKLLAKDREAFSPLPETRFIGTREELRKVTLDCLFSFGGSRYSAPWFFAGRQIWVRVVQGFYLEVYSQANKLIARHTLAKEKGAVVIDKEHYRGNNRTEGNFQRLRQLFQEDFPGHELFLEKLQAQKRINAHRHLFQFLELAKLYHKQDMIEAISVCLKYNVFNATFIAGYLEKNFRQTFQLPLEAVSLKRYHLASEPVTRDLREYQQTLNLQQPTDTEDTHAATADSH
jgi:transposase